MFGIFTTNKTLRARVAALHVRNDSANATITGLRQVIKNERESRRKLEAEYLRTIEAMQQRLINAGIMRPTIVAKPSAPGQSRFTMPTRTMQRDEPIINHGSSTPDLGAMMLGGLMMQSSGSSASESDGASERSASTVASGGGGNFAGGGASSSWGSSSSSGDSSGSSSDSSSGSSDSGGSSSSD